MNGLHQYTSPKQMTLTSADEENPLTQWSKAKRKHLPTNVKRLSIRIEDGLFQSETFRIFGDL